MGLAFHLRRYIQNFAMKTTTLTNLLKNFVTTATNRNYGIQAIIIALHLMSYLYVLILVSNVLNES